MKYTNIRKNKVNKKDIVLIIQEHARLVIPKLEGYQFQQDDSLKELGANSIDRSEIIMMTLESLYLKTPLIEFASAENIEDLAGILLEKKSSN